MKLVTVRRIVTMTAVGWVLPASESPGQAQPFTGTTIQQTVTERWRNAGQTDVFTRFETRTDNFRVVRDERTGSGATVVVRGGLTGADSSLTTVDPRGGVRVQHFTRPPIAGRPPMPAGDSMRLRRFTLLSGRPRTLLVMPDARVWELARSAPPGARIGTRWVDTLDLETARDGARHHVTGQRVSQVVGDTSIDGRSMLVIRDSAAVTFEERFLIEAYMLDTTEQVDRRATGIIRGRWVLDPERAHPRWSADTTTLRGTATLTAPGGRVFTSPAIFERTRQTTALTPTELAARNAGERPFSIVRVPFTELEKRIQQAGPAITDSILAVIRSSANPLQRDSLLSALELWGRIPRPRLAEEALRMGDTLRAWDWLQYSAEAMNAESLRAWLPLFSDQTRLWRFGMTPDAFVEQVAMQLASAPPVAESAPSAPQFGPVAVMTRQRSSACVPEACQLVAELWPTAQDPRLRALGLLTRAMQDPRHWGDSLRRNVAIAPGVLQRGVALLDGVGASWQASSKLMMPAPGSDWRRWSEWMTGQAPGTTRPPLPSGRVMPPLPITRFDGNHRNAIVVHSAATGRNVPAELHDAFARATADSARLVFGTLAAHTGGIVVTSDLLATWLSDPSPLIRTLGENAIATFVADSSRSMPDVEAAPLLDSLLAILVDRAPMWSRLGGDTAQFPAFAAELQQGALRMYADSLPAAVVARWSSRITPISSAARGVGDQPAVTTYTLTRPRVAGRIVVLGYSVTTQRGPRAYAQGSTFYLLRTDEGYRLVWSMSWIT